MTMIKFLPAVAATALLFSVGTTAAQAAIRTGTLTCDIAGGVGMIVASSKAVTCRYNAFNGLSEVYTGEVRKFGVDVGVTYAGRVVWAVFEPAVSQGALAGNYTGVSAEATVGAGLGANVLVGGGNGGVTLQPLSVQGQTGLNVAAGIGNLNIQLAAADVAPIVPMHHGHRWGHSHRHHHLKHGSVHGHSHHMHHRKPVHHKAK